MGTYRQECPICKKKMDEELNGAYAIISKKEYDELKKNLKIEFKNSYVAMFEDVYLDNDCKLHIDVGGECRGCGAKWGLTTEVEAGV